MNENYGPSAGTIDRVAETTERGPSARVLACAGTRQATPRLAWHLAEPSTKVFPTITMVETRHILHTNRRQSSLESGSNGTVQVGAFDVLVWLADAKAGLRLHLRARHIKHTSREVQPPHSPRF